MDQVINIFIWKHKTTKNKHNNNHKAAAKTST